MPWRRLKTINSHVGKYRFLHECEDTGLWVARQPDIPSPYAYGPTWPVYNWKGKNVIIRETRHKQYEVFEVPASEPLLKEEN